LNGPVLATRTRKARRPGRCVLCRGPVLIGQRIALTGGGWAHVSCVLAANTATTKESETA
jgi:hypothetical protein